MKKNFKIITWVIVIFITLFMSFAALGFYRKYEKNKTAEAIERINSRKITLADVMGENLPPIPDKELNDSTIAGIDLNNNVIRDDVELAIFERYLDSAKIRAAMLQYAQALQLELTEVFNSETLVTTIQKEDLAYGCLYDANLLIGADLQNEIHGSIINTDLRKKRIEEVFQYLTTHGYINGLKCDIDLSSLPN